MYVVKFYEGKECFDDAYSIRESVFIKEQGFHNEIDEIDDTCIHCVIYKENKPIACGRFYSEKKEEVSIGRIAVLKEYRKNHLGKMVMEEIEKKIIQLGYKKAGLSAQCQAQGFYEKLGYKQEGDVYLDEHCPHIHMSKRLKEDL